jgi:hypothetical protein
MRRAFRLILLALLTFAVAGGSTPGFAMEGQPCAAMASASMPCDKAMPASPSGHMKPVAPCDCPMHGCMCLMHSVSALPANFQAKGSRVQYSMIDYWIFMSTLAGLDRQPEPLPPRTT